jgi:hypothetical protein
VIRKGNIEQFTATKGADLPTSSNAEIPPSVPHCKKSPDWLQSFPGFEDYSDKQALETIHTLEKLAHILLSVTTTNQANPHEEP